MQLPGKLSKHRLKRFRHLFDTLRKRRSGADDRMVEAQHDAVFAQTDCLSCANCCKTHPPLLEGPDITRIAKHLNLSQSAFMGQYLLMDEDGDWVFHTTPCPFLGADNYCSIYEQRPRACREYPHTNRKKLYQIEDLTLKNAEICPAVVPILERIATELNIQ